MLLSSLRRVPYSSVLFDLDHTLFDTDASEAAAFAATVAAVGIDDPGAVFPTYDRINQGLWRAVERGETTPNELRTTRFELFAAAVGIDADPVFMADTFVEGLGASGQLYPGARDVLELVAATSSVALITNGLGPVQRARVERLGIDDYFDAIVISGEVGVSKPSPEIFDAVFDQLGGSGRDDAVIVGDSLASDMAGGINAEIDTCWYNPDGLVNESGLEISLEVRSLALLPQALLSPAVLPPVLP